MLRVSVIVPARNAEATLPRALAALAAQDVDEEFEVIVVDDQSDDATAEVVRSAPGSVRLVSQSRSGAAAARNRGVAESRASHLAFCDADVFPTPGWLRAGLGALQWADIVQGRVLPDPEARLGPFDRSLWITHQVGLWETANLFVTRRTFERVGGFENWLGVEHGRPIAEDTWFGYQALRQGARTGFSAEALAYHAVFEQSWQAYVSERARLRFFPAMARRMPELRRDFLHAGVFLNRRTQLLDAGLLGGLLALRLHSPWPLVTALPYLREARRHARRARPFGPSAAAVATIDVAADLLGLAALVAGSARHQALVV